MGTCPDAVKRLVDRFDQQSDQIRSPDYHETLIRIQFINPPLREFAGTSGNGEGVRAQALRLLLPRPSTQNCGFQLAGKHLTLA
jgi:hypothetical protein